MLVLTFSTGIIDAVGYLGLDRVFTANMTGNVVILGMAVAGADDLPILGPALALIGFFLGALAAGRILRNIPVGWTWRTTVIFGSVGSIVAASAITVSVGKTPAEPIGLIVTTALGMAMGAQAAAARHLSVKDVTTVVVTSTLTGLAADSYLGGRIGAHPWRRRLGAVALVCLGALVGALALQVHIGFGMGLAAAVILLAAVAGHLTRAAGPA
jgi:uncharacterized membrane protein YoaK (UPF0700 family)